MEGGHERGEPLGVAEVDAVVGAVDHHQLAERRLVGERLGGCGGRAWAVSATSVGPSARRSRRLLGGSRSQRRSPSIRRMKRSAASAGSSVPNTACAPALVDGHQSRHGIGDS